MVNVVKQNLIVVAVTFVTITKSHLKMPSGEPQQKLDIIQLPLVTPVREQGVKTMRLQLDVQPVTVVGPYACNKASLPLSVRAMDVKVQVKKLRNPVKHVIQQVEYAERNPLRLKSQLALKMAHAFGCLEPEKLDSGVAPPEISTFFFPCTPTGYLSVMDPIFSVEFPFP